MHSRINFNGEITLSNSLRFELNHPIFLSGEILQEKIRLFQNKFMFVERHYFHLMAQMRMARMEIPMTYTPDFFYEQLSKLKEETKLENGLFNFYVTQSSTATDFWISAEEMPNQIYFNQDYTLDLYRETHVSTDFHQRLNFLNPRLKILKLYAQENGIDDLILLNHKKAVAHSMHGNIFMIQGQQVFTPSMEEGAKDNVLRDRVLQACKRTPEIDNIQEVELFPFKLTHADEIFIAQNGKGIIKVVQLRKKKYTDTITQSIVKILSELD